MEWVQIEGGSDERLQALLAGQIDVAALQPRHLLPLEEAGGEMIFQEYKDAPRRSGSSPSETMENNQRRGLRLPRGPHRGQAVDLRG